MKIIVQFFPNLLIYIRDSNVPTINVFPNALQLQHDRGAAWRDVGHVGVVMGGDGSGGVFRRQRNCRRYTFRRLSKEVWFLG